VTQNSWQDVPGASASLNAAASAMHGLRLSLQFEVSELEKCSLAMNLPRYYYQYYSTAMDEHAW